MCLTVEIRVSHYVLCVPPSKGCATANAALAAANVAAAVENMVVAGTDGGAEPSTTASPAPAPTPATAPTPAAAPAAPAPPLRKAKTKEGKGKVGQMWNINIGLNMKRNLSEL